MKLYDLDWATNVYWNFYEEHPRAVQINERVLLYLKKQRYLIFIEDVARLLVKCIRTTKGQTTWKEYKRLVKQVDPPGVIQMEKFSQELLHTAKLFPDDTSQKELISN